jgi:hypothetical protein
MDTAVLTSTIDRPASAYLFKRLHRSGPGNALGLTFRSVTARRPAPDFLARTTSSFCPPDFRKTLRSDHQNGRPHGGRHHGSSHAGHHESSFILGIPTPARLRFDHTNTPTERNARVASASSVSLRRLGTEYTACCSATTPSTSTSRGPARRTSPRCASTSAPLHRMITHISAA